jgi:hypothetical protein
MVVLYPMASSNMQLDSQKNKVNSHEHITTSTERPFIKELNKRF